MSEMYINDGNWRGVVQRVSPGEKNLSFTLNTVRVSADNRGNQSAYVRNFICHVWDQAVMQTIANIQVGMLIDVHGCLDYGSSGRDGGGPLVVIRVDGARIYPEMGMQPIYRWDSQARQVVQVDPATLNQPAPPAPAPAPAWTPPQSAAPAYTPPTAPAPAPGPAPVYAPPTAPVYAPPVAPAPAAAPVYAPPVAPAPAPAPLDPAQFTPNVAPAPPAPVAPAAPASVVPPVAGVPGNLPIPMEFLPQGGAG